MYKAQKAIWLSRRLIATFARHQLYASFFACNCLHYKLVKAKLILNEHNSTAAVRKGVYHSPVHLQAQCRDQMRFSTLEIRWHDTKPIFSCDFQPFECVQHKRQLNPYQRTAGNVSDGDGKLWRVATAGGDTNVRVCLSVSRLAKGHVTTSLSCLLAMWKLKSD